MMSGDPIVISDDDDENAVSSTETSKLTKPSTSSKSNQKQQVTLEKIYQLKEKAVALRIKQEKLDEVNIRTSNQNSNGNRSAATNCAVIKNQPIRGAVAINNNLNQNSTATDQQCYSKTNKTLSSSQRPETVSSSTPVLQDYSECSNLSSGGTMESNNRKSTDDDDNCSETTEDFAANPDYSAAVDKVKSNLSAIQTLKEAFANEQITKDEYIMTMKIFQKMNDSPLATNRANTSSISNGSHSNENCSIASGSSANARPDCSTPLGSGTQKRRQTSSIEPSRSRDTSMSSIRNVTGIDNSFDEISGKYFLQY